MKLTRRLLRKLIIEAIIDESRRYIDTPDSGLTRADRAYQSAVQKDMHAAALHPNLSTLLQSTNIPSRVQGRDLAHAIAPAHSALAQAGPLTPAEETALDQMGYQKSFEADKGLETVIDKEALYGAMKSKSEDVLKHFGFKYIEDIPHLDPVTGEAGYKDVHEMLSFEAKSLGCGVYDLAFVDTQDSNKTYHAILDIMREMPRSKKRHVPIEQEIRTGSFGVHETHDLDGLRVVFSAHMGGYYTATICGK